MFRYLLKIKLRINQMCTFINMLFDYVYFKSSLRRVKEYSPENMLELQVLSFRRQKWSKLTRSPKFPLAPQAGRLSCS